MKIVTLEAELQGGFHGALVSPTFAEERRYRSGEHSHLLDEGVVPALLEDDQLCAGNVMRQLFTARDGRLWVVAPDAHQSWRVHCGEATAIVNRLRHS